MGAGDWKVKRIIFILLALIFSSGPGIASRQQATAEVRVIYLVPSDRQPRAEFPAALTKAANHLQRWYSDQLNGKSFKLHDPVVEIRHSTHDSSWFLTNSTGSNPSLNLWFNSVADAQAIFNDPSYIYILYVDIAPAGQATGGAGGVALLHEGDILGILGKHPGTGPSDSLVCRWVGGLGHELGHALGLPHPPECDSHQVPDSAAACQSLMYLGYLVYPDTHFVQADKDRLNQSPFIATVQTSPITDCSTLVASGEPLVTTAQFDGNKTLIIEGSKFGTSPRVFINNVDKSHLIRESSDGMIRLKKPKKKLGLVTGDNTIQVFAGNTGSNLFVLKL